MTAPFKMSLLSVLFSCFLFLLSAVLQVSSASAALTPAANDFGLRYVGGGAAEMSFTVDNPGASPLAVTAVNISGPEASDYSVTGNTCQNPIPEGGSCAITVAFSPSSPGVRTAQLEITTSDTLNPLLAASLSGTAILQRYLLSVGVLGDGSGSVNSSTPGIDCPATVCSSEYDTGTTVVLTPSPSSVSLFAGWSGCNSVLSGVCTVSMNGARYVTATFVRDKSLLNYRWEGSGPDGGVVNQILFSPDAGTMFAATSGGVFLSGNGGSNWSAANAGLAGFDVRRIAVSPGFGTDRTLFAATSSGLFTSNNAGTSWTFAGNGIAGFDITSVAVSPDYISDTTLFAGTTSGLFRSSDAGASWVSASTDLANQTVRAVAVSPAFAADNTVFAATAGGVFRSDNRGATWSRVGALLNGSNVLAVALSPDFASDGTIYAGTDNGGVFRFDLWSGDWISVTPAGNSQSVVSLAVSHNYTADRKVIAGTSNGLYLTNDGGATWTQRNVVNWGSRFFGAVAFSPTDSSAGSIYVGSRGGGVYFSNDGGAFWFLRSSGLSALAVKKIAYSPDFSNDRTAFAATAGGVYRTTDGGVSWAPFINGIDSIDIRSLALSPAYQADRTLFAVSDGGVYRSSDNGYSWTVVKGGISPGAIAVSPAYVANRTLYVATLASEVYRSLDGGGNWEAVNSGMEGRAIHDLAITANGLVFASTDNGVHMLDGAGWVPVSAGKVTGGDKTTRSVGVSPDFVADNTIYAATDGYGVIVTTDGGVTWETANTGLTDLRVQSLALAPDFSTSRTLFAATAGGGVFRSTTAGAQWVPYNNELSNQEILAVAVSPAYATDRQVLAGSNGSGIYRLIITEPQIAISPSAIDFGTVPLSGTSGNRTVTLANSGQVDLRVSLISLTGAASADFSLKQGSCPTALPFTLLPGESCTVSVSFDPTTAVGARGANIAIQSDSTAHPLTDLPLAGTAYDPPPFGTITITGSNGGSEVTITPDVTLNLNAIDNSGLVSSMRFSNDNAAWGNWELYASTFPWRLSTIGGDGRKTVYVQYRDAADNVSDSFQASIVLDSTPPTTTITSMPAINYNYPDGIFEFVSSKPSSTFTCQIGTGPVTACTSPFSFSGLADGSYTIAVIATDSVGNTGPAAGYSWTIDTVPPDTSLTVTPPVLTNSATAAFAFAATEPGGTFQCKFDNGPWGPCPTPYTLTEVPDGSHTLAVRARDLAGNTDPTPSSFTWTVDTHPPVTTIGSKPSNPTNLIAGSIAFAANEPVSNQDCTLDGIVTAGCSTPFTFSGLSEGSHTFTVRSRDLAGNIETTAASYTWRVDLTPPTTTIVSKPPLLANQNSASFTFGSSETGSTFECALDGAQLAACANPLSLSALSDGLHHLVVRAVDPAGNPDNSTVAYDWTVDTTAPDTLIGSTPANPSSVVASTFTFTATEPDSTFQCSIDAGAWGACASGVTYPVLANGPHTFMVRSVDPAGNIDQTPASYSWTINVVSAQSVKVVGIGQPEAFYSGINEALTSYPAGTNPSVMLKGIDFMEEVRVNRCSETATFMGGYNNDFTARSGMTPIYGSITVACGILVVDGVEIR